MTWNSNNTKHLIFLHTRLLLNGTPLVSTYVFPKLCNFLIEKEIKSCWTAKQTDEFDRLKSAERAFIVDSLSSMSTACFSKFISCSHKDCPNVSPSFQVRHRNGWAEGKLSDSVFEFFIRLDKTLRKAWVKANAHFLLTAGTETLSHLVSFLNNMVCWDQATRSKSSKLLPPSQHRIVPKVRMFTQSASRAASLLSRYVPWVQFISS